MRVAVCFSGLLRSFRYCYPSVYRGIIDPYKADVFMYVPEEEKMQYKLEIMENKEHIKTLKVFKEVVIDEKFYNNRTWRSITAQQILRLMTYLKEVEALKSQYEKEQGFKYDWVFRCRCDTILENQLEDLSKLDNGFIYVPANEHCHGGVNDRFAFGSSDLMKMYHERIDLFDDYFNHGGVIHDEAYLRSFLEMKKIPIKTTTAYVKIVRGENCVREIKQRGWMPLPVLNFSNGLKWNLYASSKGPWANKIFKDGKLLPIGE